MPHGRSCKWTSSDSVWSTSRGYSASQSAGNLRGLRHGADEAMMPLELVSHLHRGARFLDAIGPLDHRDCSFGGARCTSCSATFQLDRQACAVRGTFTGPPFILAPFGRLDASPALDSLSQASGGIRQLYPLQDPATTGYCAGYQRRCDPCGSACGQQRLLPAQAWGHPHSPLSQHRQSSANKAAGQPRRLRTGCCKGRRPRRDSLPP